MKLSLLVKKIINCNAVSHSTPFWLAIIYPPGSVGRSVLREVENKDSLCISRLTPSALISGLPGKDISLLPKLKSKTLLIRDFSFIDMLRKSERDEIIYTLSGARSGTVGKAFGNGIQRTYYNMRLGLIINVNGNHWEKLKHKYASFCEQFIVYHVGTKRVSVRGIRDSLLARAL